MAVLVICVGEGNRIVFLFLLLQVLRKERKGKERFYIRGENIFKVSLSVIFEEGADFYSLFIVLFLY